METTPGSQPSNPLSEEMRLKQSTMLIELAKAMGIVGKAAELAGVTREMHEHWVKTDADYRRRLHEVHEGVIDAVEEMLFNRMKNDTTAMIFYLRTQARHRGYIQNDRYSYPQDNATTYTAIFETPEEGDIWKNL